MSICLFVYQILQNWFFFVVCWSLLYFNICVCSTLSIFFCFYIFSVHSFPSIFLYGKKRVPYTFYVFWLLYVSANKRKFEKYDRGCQANFRKNVMKTQYRETNRRKQKKNERSENKGKKDIFLLKKRRRRIHVIRF